MFLLDLLNKKNKLPSENEALTGRDEPVPTATHHFVNKAELKGPFPEGMQKAMFGLGCFWGAERIFWELPGVYMTAVGYAGGATRNPTYQEVCTGMTGHNEVVLVIFDPAIITYETLLATFWDSHDPTQGMRQGNDVGTQYRSGIYTYSPSQRDLAEMSSREYAKALSQAGRNASITTEITDAPEFYYAEDYHQQYLAKNPSGYCGLGGTGVSCPIGTGVSTG